MNDKINVANKSGVPDLPPGYKPMTEGQLKMVVEPRAGYHRHWFRGDAGRIARAKQAGYEMVQKGDVHVNNQDLGGDAKNSGDTDLGSVVSIISGQDLDPVTGQPGRMYLMECPEHLFEYAQSLLAERNESVAEALRGGKIGAGESGETKSDVDKRYLKGQPSDLFIPNKQRRA